MFQDLMQGVWYDNYRLRKGWLEEDEPEQHLNLTFTGLLLLALVQTAQGWVRWQICQALGHKLKDDSHFGPDSGTECLYCVRCGWSWQHIYY